MEIEHRIVDNTCILIFKGDLALEGVTAVKKYISPLLEDSTINAMAMDLEDVGFIDSSGVGVIMGTIKTFEQRDAKFALFHVSKKNTKVFRMTKLDKMVNIYPTELDTIDYLTPKKSRA